MCVLELRSDSAHFSFLFLLLFSFIYFFISTDVSKKSMNNHVFLVGFYDSCFYNLFKVFPIKI